jgi:hypothetical protein
LVYRRRVHWLRLVRLFGRLVVLRAERVLNRRLYVVYRLLIVWRLAWWLALIEVLLVLNLVLDRLVLYRLVRLVLNILVIMRKVLIILILRLSRLINVLAELVLVDVLRHGLMVEVSILALKTRLLYVCLVWHVLVHGLKLIWRHLVLDILLKIRIHNWRHVIIVLLWV